jgi:5-methyltetrahydropteroyltriglutamate--homocysteine methyltransferase
VGSWGGETSSGPAPVPLEQLALSPQCGFNSASQRIRLSLDEQAAKLRRVVEVAHGVWGRATA